jgi:hypothetical protein
MTSQAIARASGRSERRLCRRNRFLGEVSEGAVEAPSDLNPLWRFYRLTP